MAIDFKGAHFPSEVILMGVRWYVASPLSTRIGNPKDFFVLVPLAVRSRWQLRAAMAVTSVPRGCLPRPRAARPRATEYGWTGRSGGERGEVSGVPSREGLGTVGLEKRGKDDFKRNFTGTQACDKPSRHARRLRDHAG